MTSKFNPQTEKHGKQRLGRRMGRRMNAGRRAALKKLAQYSIPAFEDETVMLDIPSLFKGYERFWLEVGFGNGEHLVQQATLHPDVGFIGCEPFLNGLSACIKDIEVAELSNIRLSDGDARELLPVIPPQTFERIYLLFPDPWPKARHHKRRFISLETTAQFARLLTPEGVLILASDHPELALWMRDHIEKCDGLTIINQTADGWSGKPKDWIPTRYQEKALASDNTYYLVVMRTV